MTKDLVSVFDLSPREISSLLTLARELKSGRRKKPVLAGKTLGLIFEKPSTRTTVSFAVAMHQLGGLPLILNAENLQRRRGEPISDTARTLSRYLDGIMIRAFRHQDVEEFALWSTIPVINGLTDREHPCQIFGDILTVMERKKVKTPSALKKCRIVYVGDGNNVANSLMGACAVLGLNFTLARPKGYGPDDVMLNRSREAAAASGAVIDIVEDPDEAVRNADVIYTDVWTSMGSEGERDKRRKAFRPYQVNASLLGLARPDCIVMHCLPANRGEEITEEVMEGEHSVIFDQAENRLHIQKAVLVRLLQ